MESAKLISPPGDTILETAQGKGLKQHQLAKMIGVSRGTMFGLITGSRAINAEIADALEKALGIPASFWLERERLYMEYLCKSIGK